MKKFFALAAVAALAMSASAQNLYMTGACANPGEEGALPANWAPENPLQFDVVDGNYVATVKGLQQFKLSTNSNCSGWDDWNAVTEEGNAFGCIYPEGEQGVWASLYVAEPSSPNIFCPWEGDWTVTVKGDLTELMLTTTTPKPADADAIKLYFRGDMNGWNAEEDWMLTQVNNKVFKYTFDAEHSIEVGQSFKIADSAWAKYNFVGDNDPILLDVDKQLYYNGSNISVEEPCDGVCWFIMSGDEYYVVMSNDPDYEPEWKDGELSAVKEVVVANEAPAYYNLQGVKVANPENGLYIVVKGGKAYKTILK